MKDLLITIYVLLVPVVLVSVVLFILSLVVKDMKPKKKIFRNIFLALLVVHFGCFVGIGATLMDEDMTQTEQRETQNAEMEQVETDQEENESVEVIDEPKEDTKIQVKDQEEKKEEAGKKTPNGQDVNLGWGADAQYGYYRMSENEKYPYVWVLYQNTIDEFGNDSVDTWITILLESGQRYDNEFAVKEPDGAYRVEGYNYDYLVYFNGNGSIKVELEKSEDAQFAAGISKGKYKKAAGVYKVFEASNLSVNETLEKEVEKLKY